MVVNGQAEFVGDDGNRAYQVIGAAKQMQTTSVDLKNAISGKDPDLVDLSVQVTSPKNPKPRASDVYLAVTESELESQVLRGENGSGTLRWYGVSASLGGLIRADRTSDRSPTPCAFPMSGSARTCGQWSLCRSTTRCESPARP
jgi:hypothetical protein